MGHSDKIYIEILSSLEPLDAVILKFLSKQGWNLVRGTPGYAYNYDRLAKELNVPDEKIQLSLHNLSRLGCITYEKDEGAGITTGLNANDKSAMFKPSVLGFSLLEACLE